MCGFCSTQKNTCCIDRFHDCPHFSITFNHFCSFNKKPLLLKFRSFFPLHYSSIFQSSELIFHFHRCFNIYYVFEIKLRNFSFAIFYIKTVGDCSCLFSYGQTKYVNLFVGYLYSMRTGWMCVHACFMHNCGWHVSSMKFIYIMINFPILPRLVN